MRGFKSFDLFQKISDKDMNKPTMIGSFLSVSAITLMIYLFIREVKTFFNSEIIKDTIVTQDKDPSGRVDLSLSIQFSSLPCNLVSLDQEDSLGNHDFDITSTINKERIITKNKKFERIRFSHAGQNAPLLYKALENNETCSVLGHISISKVPGSFHVSFHNF